MFICQLQPSKDRGEKGLKEEYLVARGTLYETHT
jgi:hypothetical protein